MSKWWKSLYFFLCLLFYRKREEERKREKSWIHFEQSSHNFNINFSTSKPIHFNANLILKQYNEFVLMLAKNTYSIQTLCIRCFVSNTRFVLFKFYSIVCCFFFLYFLLYRICTFACIHFHMLFTLISKSERKKNTRSIPMTLFLLFSFKNPFIFPSKW